jgi:hypothetical protein
LGRGFRVERGEHNGTYVRKIHRQLAKGCRKNNYSSVAVSISCSCTKVTMCGSRATPISFL